MTQAAPPGLALLNNMGVAYLHRGEYDKALTLLVEALDTQADWCGGGTDQHHHKKNHPQEPPTCSTTSSTIRSSFQRDDDHEQKEARKRNIGSSSSFPFFFGGTTALPQSQGVANHMEKEDHQRDDSDNNIVMVATGRTHDAHRVHPHPHQEDDDSCGSDIDLDDDDDDDVDFIYDDIITIVRNQQEAEKERHLLSQVAYIYDRGLLLNKLEENNDDEMMTDDHSFRVVYTTCQSAAILFNLGLANHKSSVAKGFHHTAQGTELLQKALHFYSMSLLVVDSIVLSSHKSNNITLIFGLEGQRLLVALMNNMGQIFHELGNLETAEVCFSWNESFFAAFMNALAEESNHHKRDNHDATIVSLELISLFSRTELKGLLFNASSLALSHKNSIAAAA